jgi:hypothetical protein
MKPLRDFGQVGCLREADDSMIGTLSIDSSVIVLFSGYPGNLGDNALRVSNLSTVLFHLVRVLAE